jgi:dihydropteroate synthase
MKNYLNAGGKLLNCSTPMVMGILNITPDSFYDGGNFTNDKAILLQTEKMIAEGAAIIDIGAQSTRPDARPVSAEDEWKRLRQPLIMLRKTFPGMTFSVDTFYSQVAEQSVDEGADMINDVSAGAMDEEMFSTIARLNVPYVLMHMKGTPMTMQHNPEYADVVKEVMDYFAMRIQCLVMAGVTDLIIDPGFGFGKNLVHNFELLSRLELFKIFDRPVLAGFSRKSMVNKVLGTKPEHALNGTTVLNTIALQKGAGILRVHDVKEAAEAIRLADRITD